MTIDPRPESVVRLLAAATSGTSSPNTSASAGDLSAVVERLFVECEARLGRFLVQFVRDRELAADLLQDTFQEALTERGKLLAAENREAWLFGIARHRGLRALRRRVVFQKVLRRLPAAEVAGDIEATEVLDLLRRTLPPDDRALLLLRYLHGFETREVAEITGMTVDAVRQRLWRATTRLRAVANDTQAKGSGG